MKKEYKKPSIEVVKIEQALMLSGSKLDKHDEVSNNDSFSRMGRDNSGFEDEDW